MRTLILNADGFGFTFGNNRAILEVLERGFVRSVSVNVTWPAVDEVQTLVRNFPHVTVGIHWNVSVGPSILPASEIPSLIGPNGEFHANQFNRMALRGKLDVHEIERELSAQTAVLRDKGITLSHWDSHASKHVFPGYFEAALAVARREGLFKARPNRYFMPFHHPRWRNRLAYRLRHPSRLLTHYLGNRKTVRMRRSGMAMPDYRLVIRTLGAGAEYRLDAWQEAFDQLPDGLGLIAIHPGYPDETLRKYSGMTETRLRELELFRSDAIADAARDAGIESVSYQAVPFPEPRSADSREGV